MKPMTNLQFLVCVTSLCVILLCCGILLGQMGFPTIFTDHMVGGIDDIKEIRKSDLEGTVKDFRGYVTSIFNYNVSNVGKSLSLEELKQVGGVCSHYAEVYEMLARHFGYKTKSVVVKVDSRTAHIFTIIYDSTGYCVTDQTSLVHCFSYGEFFDG